MGFAGPCGRPAEARTARCRFIPLFFRCAGPAFRRKGAFFVRPGPPVSGPRPAVSLPRPVFALPRPPACPAFCPRPCPACRPARPGLPVSGPASPPFCPARPYAPPALRPPARVLRPPLGGRRASVYAFPAPAMPFRFYLFVAFLPWGGNAGRTADAQQSALPSAFCCAPAAPLRRRFFCAGWVDRRGLL